MNSDLNGKFFARINLPKYQVVPVRAYVHNAGKERWYNSKSITTTVVGVAEKYLLDTFQPISHDLRKFDYIIAVLWGDMVLDVDQNESHTRGNKMIDCFGYSDVSKDPKEWPGNPDIEPWFMMNGVYVKKTDIGTAGKSCEDSIIVLGIEGEYRRQCKDLKEYLQNPPKIIGLENIIKK